MTTIRSHIAINESIRQKAEELKNYYELKNFSAVVCFAINELYKQMKEGQNASTHK